MLETITDSRFAEADQTNSLIGASDFVISTGIWTGGQIFSCEGYRKENGENDEIGVITVVRRTCLRYLIIFLHPDAPWQIWQKTRIQNCKV